MGGPLPRWVCSGLNPHNASDAGTLAMLEIIVRQRLTGLILVLNAVSRVTRLMNAGMRLAALFARITSSMLVIGLVH